MKFYSTFYFLAFSLSLHAQYKHNAVLNNIFDEQELFDAIRENFTPNSVLDFSIARDTLFLKIDAVNRNLSCIYTGLTLNIPEGSDPTQAVFLGGDANGINTEHTYPQGFGLDQSKGRADMHHLFPSRVKTNNDRGNLPFGESNDNSTKTWYKDKEELKNIPTTNVDSYSELSNDGRFEPREMKKGDIARAMFYVYTIYRDEVITESPGFFDSQKSTLCEWHFQDPVDQSEWERTFKIALYQNNKPNPFVLDCSLARLYCSQLSNQCMTTSIDEELNEKISFVVKEDESKIYFQNEIKGYKIEVCDLYGRNIKFIKNENFIELLNLPSGMIFMKINNINTQKNYTYKFIMTR
ncbi:MAG: hypothetical protein RLZZ546_2404 [Bacteroidota bacterium]|jgi:hypothetical protein